MRRQLNVEQAVQLFIQQEGAQTDLSIAYFVNFKNLGTNLTNNNLYLHYK